MPHCGSELAAGQPCLHTLGAIARARSQLCTAAHSSQGMALPAVQPDLWPAPPFDCVGEFAPQTAAPCAGTPALSTSMSSVAARLAARVVAPVRAAPVRRFTTTRAPKGGDGHNHAVSLTARPLQQGSARPARPLFGGTCTSERRWLGALGCLLRHRGIRRSSARLRARDTERRWAPHALASPRRCRCKDTARRGARLPLPPALGPGGGAGVVLQPCGPGCSLRHAAPIVGHFFALRPSV